MIIGCVFEFVLGNTFSFIVFGSYGAFWLTYGATLVPSFNAAIAYSPTAPVKAITNPMFVSTFAFFLLYMGLLTFVFLICSIRTNIIQFGMFLCLTPAFLILAGGFWQIAEATEESLNMYQNLEHAAGGLTFVVSLLGWYLLLAQMFIAVDFPINLPVGDLSRFVKGAREKAKIA